MDDEEDEEIGCKVGDAVEVYWDEEDEWYRGDIERVSDAKGVNVSY